MSDVYTEDGLHSWAACGVGNVELHFENSGIKIRPYELDIWRNKGQLDYSRVRISEEAGSLLMEKSNDYEPVKIMSDGTIISRQFVEPDTLEVSRDDAFLNLLDELGIFKYVQLDKDFNLGLFEQIDDGSWTLEDVINHIVLEVKNSSVNEYNVIEGWSESGMGTDIDQDRASIDEGGAISQAFDKVTLGIATAIADYTVEKLAGLHAVEIEDVDFDFKDKTALQALHMIGSEYGIDFFTLNDGNGFVYAGKKLDTFKIYPAGFPNGFYNLIGWSIPRTMSTPYAVRVEGKKLMDLSEYKRSSEADAKPQNVRSYGVAIRNDISGGNVYKKQAPKGAGINELVEIAENQLTELAEKGESGTATIDVMSSDQELLNNSQSDIRRIDVGDFLALDDHKNICRNISGNYADGGAFLVTSAHHQINPRKGWHVTTDIQRVSDRGIEKGAYLFDYEEQQVIEEYHHLLDFDENNELMEGGINVERQILEASEE